MNTPKIFILAITLLVSTNILAQDIQIEGTLNEVDDRGIIKQAKVVILDFETNALFLDTITDMDGQFIAQLPSGKDFRIITDRDHFFQMTDTLSTKNLALDQDTLAVAFEMTRKPGYVFDVTIASAQDSFLLSGGIQGAQVEIYNNTTLSEELNLKEYPYPNFKFNFEHGNHYTIMVRKKGFLTKRVEAYINVEGCILCFDGLGMLNPGVTDVMTNDNTQGTFLAHVDLEPIAVHKTFKIDNIYYDYNMANIRADAAEELDKLITILKDNPAIKVEMGSHTDIRGRDSYNMSLSEKRAKAAVDYLVNKGVNKNMLTFKGYGETDLVNTCAVCDEQAHQENRRTELKIVGIRETDPLADKSLEDILVEENLLQTTDEKFARKN